MQASQTPAPRPGTAHAAPPIFIPWPSARRAPFSRDRRRPRAPGGGETAGRPDTVDTSQRASALELARKWIGEATGHTCIADYLGGSGRFGLIASRVPEELTAFLLARPELAPELFSFAADTERWTFWRVSSSPGDPDAGEPRDAPAALSSRTLRIQLTELDALPL